MISLKGVKPGTPEYKRLYHKRRRMIRTQLGRCQACNAKIEHGTRCATCCERYAAIACRRVYERKENRICTPCLKPMDREGWTCIACTEKSRLANRALRDARRIAHECIQCGDALDLTEQQKISGKGYTCERCRDKRRSHERKRK